MRSRTILFAALAAAFCAAHAHSAPKARAVPKPLLPRISWSFQVRRDHNGVPHSQVFLVVSDRRIVIERDVVDQFAVLSRQEYSTHGVPAVAAVACTGWWAGQGEKLYAVLRPESLVVYRCVLDEHAPSRAYRPLKSIPL